MGNSPQTPKKLIFLDIDGVLNNEKSDVTKKYVIEDELLERLKRILDAVPGCAIVLSSTWRNRQHSRDLVREIFSDFGLPKYISCTPIFLSANRVDEIVYWLRRNTTSDSTLGLDRVSSPEREDIFSSTQLPEEEYLMKELLVGVTHCIVIDDTDLRREKSKFTQFISERFVHVDRMIGLSDIDVAKSIDLLNS